MVMAILFSYSELSEIDNNNVLHKPVKCEFSEQIPSEDEVAPPHKLNKTDWTDCFPIPNATTWGMFNCQEENIITVFGIFAKYFKEG